MILQPHSLLDVIKLINCCCCTGVQCLSVPGNCDLGGGAVLCSPPGWETPPGSPSAENFWALAVLMAGLGGSCRWAQRGAGHQPQIWALLLHPAWPEPVLAVLRWGQVRRSQKGKCPGLEKVTLPFLVITQPGWKVSG